MTDHKPLTKDKLELTREAPSEWAYLDCDIRDAVEGLRTQLQTELNNCWETEDEKIAYRTALQTIDKWFPVFAEEKEEAQK